MKLNRIFALVLTLCMMLSIAQFPVFAEEITFEASGRLNTEYASPTYTYSSSQSRDLSEYSIKQVALPTSPTIKSTEYYANSLSAFQKQIYRAAINGFSSISDSSHMLRQGVCITYSKKYAVTITSQGQFDVFLNNKLQSEYNSMDFQTLYNAIQYDHVEYFWMQGIYCDLAADASADGSTATVNYYVYIYTDASGLFASDSALRTAAKAMTSQVNSIISDMPTTSDYDKLVYFNKWLKDNNTYNHTHLSTGSYPLAHGAYSAFTSNNNEPTGPVCQGYAYAFKYLCDKAGIHSVVVSGDLCQTGAEPGPHAWNAVELDGQWYGVDTTNNDSLGTDAYFFLVGSNSPTPDPNYSVFSETHVIDDIHTYPTLATTAYVPACYHSYDNDCDAECNGCGAVRKVSPHIYDNTCDTTCNECGEERTTSHVYDDTCDTICNVCGDERAIVHTYRSDCASECKVCGETRTPISKHTYENDCDPRCDLCGFIREAGHTYDNGCDEGCNECGEIRVISHRYNNDTDTVCSVCGADRPKETPAASFEYEISDGKVRIIKYIGTETEVVIPKTIEGYQVTGLFNTFSGNTTVKSVILPDGLETVESSTFKNCTGITALKIPDSVTKIGAYAFTSCTNLKILDIGNGVQSIDAYAFDSCTALESIKLPESLATLGHTAFSGCTSLEDVVIGGSVTSLDHTFYGCQNLKTVTLNTSMKNIGLATFFSCDSITDVYYTGSATDRASISIGIHNEGFANATWHYNYVVKCKHIYDDDQDTTCNECGAERKFKDYNVGETIAYGIEVDTSNGVVIEEATGTLQFGTPVILSDYLAFNMTVPTKAAGKTFELLVKDNDGNVLYREWIRIAGIPRLPGDVNDDGVVNNKDLGILRQYLNKWEVAINESNADVTGDGIVNNKDMGILRQYLNHWDVTLK